MIDLARVDLSLQSRILEGYSWYDRSGSISNSGSAMISVSGIGPVSALAIIAADDNAGLVQAIETKNITYLTKFPKIGKKTAQQMVLDLEGKVVVASDDLPAKVAVQTSAENQELEEAMEAMLALGYKATELKKIKKFFEGTTDTAENYIKSALKMLVK